MKLTVICANSRKDSESLKVAKWFKGAIGNDGQTVNLIDLHVSQLPLELDKLWDEDPDTMLIWNPIKDALTAAEAYVVVTPEWNGMANPSFFNLVDYTDGEMAYKPALLVGVSASRGGAYPIAQIKGFASKNTHIDFIPEHVLIRDVEKVFNKFEPEEESKYGDAYLKDRSKYALKVLYEYAKALKGLRDSGVIDHKTYPNGM
ncbi:NAD(P)H-dependent oxidoreductase [Candidatus Saccharibacteria bacterium]|nr:NAD(P)H-dependent oxidoreductase [Candidatus Saccharibacteria bacterium]